MRIVIDLQGAQSAGSRNRGIGRYSTSLAKGIIRNRAEHEVFIVLNGAFSESVEAIRSEFEDLISPSHIRVWTPSGPLEYSNPDNAWRRRSSELLREAFIAKLEPDFILVSSLFEGLVDESLTSINGLSNRIPTAVILYDLIPYIYPDIYLSNPNVSDWYYSKIGHLRQADLLLAISESSRMEAMHYLSIPEVKSINISTAADAEFVVLEITEKIRKLILEKYKIKDNFIMYTGGIDNRKNIEPLIRAFSKLPKYILRDWCLVIVCSIQPGVRRSLEELAAASGLSEGSVVLTGFVPEDDLIVLYNICGLFIFPSWHEGFGLPALEAMSCGAPVIGSNCSSLPEVIGREDALFDPHDERMITKKLKNVLLDENFRTELAEYGINQAKKFSWEKSAKQAIAALEQANINRKNSGEANSHRNGRPRMAFVSPLPPQQSGIADYSAELLPELSRHYEIDIVSTIDCVEDRWIKANCAIFSVEFFELNAHLYDRVLYHFGNSDFHTHMFRLIKKIPGVIVLHDFFLSGVIAYMDAVGIERRGWFRELHHSHGYRAVFDRFHEPEENFALFNYPCNRTVVESALGVIVHSEESRRLGRRWLTGELVKDWAVIPLLRAAAATDKKKAARRKLGIPEDDFVVCSFGSMDKTKLNHRLLQAWYNSTLSADARCRLVFVGGEAGGSYADRLNVLLDQKKAGERISITGRADPELYQNFLFAADVGVQLRTLSRGETSAAVLDCMNYGLATIVNAHGAMADLPMDAVLMLPDDFDDGELISALESLWIDKDRRELLGRNGRDVIANRHSPRKCADAYSNAIEDYYAKAQTGAYGVIRTMARIKDPPADPQAWLDMAKSISQIGSAVSPKQFLVDVTDLVLANSDEIAEELMELIKFPPEGVRIEPIYCVQEEIGYRYARRFAMRLLDCPEAGLQDDPVAYRPGDVLLGLASPETATRQAAAGLANLARVGGRSYYFVASKLTDVGAGMVGAPGLESWINWFAMLGRCDGIICANVALANYIEEWLNAFGSDRTRPVQLTWLAPATGRNEDAALLSQGSGDVLAEIRQIIVDQRWDREWRPRHSRQFWGDDPRLANQVGIRTGRWFETDARSGYLVYGPYVSLAAGRYRISVMGAIGERGASGAKMDIAVHGGRTILGVTSIAKETLSDRIFSLDIQLEVSCTDLEIRLSVTDEDDMKVLMVSIVSSDELSLSTAHA